MHLLQSKTNLQDFRLEGTGFTEGLQKLFTDSDAEYRETTTYQWIVAIGDNLMAGKKTMISYAHVDGNHWVFIAVDAEEEILYLGNPSRGEVPQEISDLYRAWCEELVPGQFERRTMNIGKQDDTVLCGIFVHGAACCMVNPHEYNLIKPSTVELECMKLFLALTSRILSSVWIISSLFVSSIANMLQFQLLDDDDSKSGARPAVDDGNDWEMDSPGICQNKCSRDSSNTPTPMPSPQKKQQHQAQAVDAPAIPNFPVFSSVNDDAQPNPMTVNSDDPFIKSKPMPASTAQEEVV
ncbi:hypothetical protein C8J56DRAFT_1048257 [Mycena floridula]|nr:hypothetical protein C8J56DRAFT_1048257 [Mycena floridula]